MLVLSLDRDIAYGKLKALILDGRLGYDEVLSERSLAKLLGLGRTPIREAVRALVREGLLTSIPAKGIFVRRLTVEELENLYDVRIALEGLAARLAALKRKPGEFRADRRALERIARLGKRADVYETQDVGWRFHQNIFAAARNPCMAQTYDNLIGQVIVAMRMTLKHDPDRVRATTVQHLEILEAIERGDGTGAEAAMHRHLADGLGSRLAIYARLLSAGPGPAQAA
jgi:DNA-binding GntR family transcriptional regulator